jgi:ABC-type nitrate/sulfonate/bicarbonate transport system substrate-binding protein
MVNNPSWVTRLRVLSNRCLKLATVSLPLLAGSAAMAQSGSAQSTQSTGFDTPPASAPAATGSSTGLRTLNVVGFEGAFNLPVWVAQQRGFFAANGLVVNLSFPSSSVEVVRALNNGSAQLSLMSIDNVLAYRRAQGEKGAPDADDLITFMGGDHGYLSLVAKPDIHSVEQLRGRTVSVDAMTTGFAFVLLEALKARGLDGTNVNIVPVGGTGYRFRALMAGKQDSTLLRSPFELLSEQQGYHILLPASRLTPAYQGTIGAVRRPWAEAHRDEVLAFLVAYHQSLEWIFDKRNRSGVMAILHAQYPELSQRYLMAAYSGLTDPRNGLIRNMTIDRAGLAEVERLRNKYAPLSSSGHANSSGVDLDYLQAARQSPGWNRQPALASQGG